MKNKIKTTKYRTIEQLKHLRENRLEMLKLNSLTTKNQEDELSLLTNQEFEDFKHFVQYLELTQTEIESFLDSPINPEMANILNCKKDEDRLNKIIKWENRQKQKKENKVKEHLWDNGIILASFALATESKHLFPSEADTYGIPTAMAISVMLFIHFVKQVKKDIKNLQDEKDEVLPHIKFFLQNKNISHKNKTNIIHCIKNLKPEETLLLSQLPRNKLKNFLEGDWREQNTILESYFYKHTNKIKKVLSIICLSYDWQNSNYRQGKIIINNILTRRLEISV